MSWTAWANGLSWLGISLLFAHELDAMRAREWRLLYVLLGMQEDLARDTFVLAHVPLLAGAIWLSTHPSDGVRISAQLALSLFLILHAGLHHRSRHHQLYEFHSRLSKGLIFAGAAVGGMHFLLTLLAVGLRQA